jgi:hypothetical protein
VTLTQPLFMLNARSSGGLRTAEAKAVVAGHHVSYPLSRKGKLAELEETKCL